MVRKKPLETPHGPLATGSCAGGAWRPYRVLSVPPAPCFRADLGYAQLWPIYPLERRKSIHGRRTFDGETQHMNPDDAIG